MALKVIFRRIRGRIIPIKGKGIFSKEKQAQKILRNVEAGRISREVGFRAKRRGQAAKRGARFTINRARIVDKTLRRAEGVRQGLVGGATGLGVGVALTINQALEKKKRKR